MTGSNSGRPWYEDWFNSSYYHLLYHGRDEQEAAAFVGVLATALHVAPGSQVLDIACGTGRHALSFAELGHRVTGVDLAPRNVRLAQQRAGGSFQVFIGDMRCLPWAQRFDLAVNLFTSFGYFDSLGDDVRALCAIRRCLRPGGRLVIDFMNVARVVSDLVDAEERYVEGIHFALRRTVADGFVTKSVLVTDPQAPAPREYVERVQALDNATFTSLLATAGLHVLARYGSYQLEPYGGDASQRLILVCGRGA